VALLGVPTLALALASTVVTTYTPVVARDFVDSAAVIGLIIGLEGMVALWLPLVVGAWSDRLDTRIGGRLPFLLGATPFVALGLIGLALMGSLAMLAVASLIFFAGYFVAYEPYRALYPDAVGEEAAGRAQATQAVWRGAGTGLALMGGGLLLALGDGAPFLVAAVIYVAAIAIFGTVLARRGIPHKPREGRDTIRDELRHLRGLIRGDKPLQAFLMANALWELSLAALKTFVVLYVTEGMGFSQTEASLVIGGVAVVVMAAALASGPIADRYGSVRVLRFALPLYGLGFLVPLFVADAWLVALSIPLIAIGGGVIMALPYAVLIPLMPEGERGSLTGYYSVSRGIGTWLGPLLGGLAIAAGAGLFEATDGYQAIWGVCAASVLLSLIPLRRLSDKVE
jgi:MFS family permease